MKKQKKSQIQIGETIAVLFVFFILVTIGFIFYAKVIKGNIELEKDELSQLRSVGVAQRVMFMPEVQCSEDNVIIDNCIDILKLEAAKSLISEKELYYYDLLEFSDIKILQIYPEEAEWEIYSRKIDNFRNKFLTNVPISLYNPATRKHSFGVLAIETLSR
ncbi:hypothetical protein HYY70_04315 [Candidatus Woesearchaeota archaeon]|nr:hypothetical protein [Candidatus Woesearchaeota archaeon]